VIAASSPAADARREARHILAERRYRGSDVPRPLHRFLVWLGDRFHFLHRFFDWAAGHLGGTGVLWTILAAIVVAFAGWLASRLARRRSRRDAQVARALDVEHSLDPHELERLAEEAERRGDLEVALRLRFRAGLLRLGRAHALELRPSLTTREARRVLRSPRFDRLARSFDEVVYGRRTPRHEDLADARAEWPRVLEEARG
jgi:uncharacterized protein DUF4129